MVAVVVVMVVVIVVADVLAVEFVVVITFVVVAIVVEAVVVVVVVDDAADAIVTITVVGVVAAVKRNDAVAVLMVLVLVEMVIVMPLKCCNRSCNTAPYLFFRSSKPNTISTLFRNTRPLSDTNETTSFLEVFRNPLYPKSLIVMFVSFLLVTSLSAKRTMLLFVSRSY